MKFGICGYGNIGKSIEKKILESDDELVAIFSRRENVASKYGSKIENYSSAKDYLGQIDVMIMCGGSQEDLEWQSVEMLELYNIIDTFDTHAKIDFHKQNLENMSRYSGKTAIYSCGWDPGLFSIARTLSANIFDCKPATFWGKGVSQGHSEALRNIKGIKDAIQFTVPNEQIMQKLKNDPHLKVDENLKHERHCYICLDKTRPFEEIETEIKNMPNYFLGQKVIINETSQGEIDDLKSKMYHKGSVFGGDGHSALDFSVSMDKNPDFTAQIVLTYAHAIPKLPVGVYSVLDIPVGMIGKEENTKYL